MKKKLAALIIVMIMLILTFASCSPKGEGVARVTGKGKIVMCTNAEFEPFEYREGDTIVGIDADIAAEIAKDLNVEVEIMDMAFDSLVTAVKSGKADFAAAGMSVTEDRKKNIDFTEAYFIASQSILVLKDSPIKGKADLEGKIIGVQLGTTGDDLVTTDAKASEVKRFNKGVDAVQDLIAGRLDAVVIDDFPATVFANKNSDTIVKLEEALSDEEYAIAVNKNDYDLTEAINKTLQRLKDSGELDKIIAKYIAVE